MSEYKDFSDQERLELIRKALESHRYLSPNGEGLALGRIAAIVGYRVFRNQEDLPIFIADADAHEVEDFFHHADLYKDWKYL